MKKLIFIIFLLNLIVYPHIINAQFNGDVNNFHFINALSATVNYTCDVTIIPVSMIFNGVQIGTSGEYSLLSRYPYLSNTGTYIRYDYIASTFLYGNNSNDVTHQVLGSVSNPSWPLYWDGDLIPPPIPGYDYGVRPMGTLGTGIYKVSFAYNWGHEGNPPNHKDTVWIDMDRSGMEEWPYLTIKLVPDNGHGVPGLMYQVVDTRQCVSNWIATVDIKSGLNQPRPNHITMWDPDPNSQCHTGHPIRDNGSFTIGAVTNPYSVMPLDPRVECYNYTSYPVNENHGYCTDKQYGNLYLNLEIKKDVTSLDRADWYNTLSVSPCNEGDPNGPFSVQEPLTLNIENDAKLTIGNNIKYTLLLNDDPSDLSPINFLMTCKTGGSLNLGIGTTAKPNILIDNRTRLLLECGSYLHATQANGQYSVIKIPGSHDGFAAGTFCDQGSIHTGSLKIIYEDGIHFLSCIYCPPTGPMNPGSYFGDSTNVSLDSGAVLIVPDSTSMVFDGSAAKLEMAPTSSIQLGHNSNIIVRNGARLVASNASFTSIDGENNSWGGIFLQSTSGDTITNCIFSNGITSLNICDTGTGVLNKELIRENTFIVFADPNQANYGIFAQDVSNITIDGNTFNMQGATPNIGIWFTNDNNMGIPAGESNINITNNLFNGGSEQIALNCLASDLTPFFIAYNGFTGVENNACTGLWARKVTGSFKYNTFLNSSFKKGINVSQSSLNILGNQPILTNAGTTLYSGNSSTLQMAPVLTSSGNLEWYGGMNSVTTNNYGNIYFEDGSAAVVDLGQNCFTLVNGTGQYNIEGIQNTELFGNSYNATQNVWNPNPPQFNVRDRSSSSIAVNYTNIYPTCGTNNLSVIGYEVNDRGDGIFDSLLITTNYQGNEFLPLGGPLYSQSMENTASGNYTGAISSLTSLMNTYDTSIYLLPALDRLYLNYQFLDSTGNQYQRNVLFGALKNYIESQMEQRQNNADFVVKAYDGYLMCLTKTQNYQEAIAGYENIINNSPDTLQRLFASWDRSAVVILMNGGGGGENDQPNMQKYQKLLLKKPAHQIAKEIFAMQTKNLLGSKGNANMDKIRKQSISNNAKISHRLFRFNPSNRKELHKKISDDFAALMGKNGILNSNKAGNNVPYIFKLYQNYPNPFNPSTTIKYDLPKDVNVTVKIYDITGRVVATLLNNEMKLAGSYQIEWKATNYASGVYFYQIKAGDFVESKKMVIIK